MMIMSNRNIKPTSPSASGNNSSISSKLMHFNKISPNRLNNRSNDENSSHDNFLKTGDNGAIEFINLAGHVTNFVDNEASLDFLSSSNVAIPSVSQH